MYEESLNNDEQKTMKEPQQTINMMKWRCLICFVVQSYQTFAVHSWSHSANRADILVLGFRMYVRPLGVVCGNKQKRKEAYDSRKFSTVNLTNPTQMFNHRTNCLCTPIPLKGQSGEPKWFTKFDNKDTEVNDWPRSPSGLQNAVRAFNKKMETFTCDAGEISDMDKFDDDLADKISVIQPRKKKKRKKSKRKTT